MEIIYKRPGQLKAGDLIGVSSQDLGKPAGNGFFKVQVIAVMRKVGIRYITTAGGTVAASDNQLFQIFEDEHRDDLTPQFPRKQQRTGRSTD